MYKPKTDNLRYVLIHQYGQARDFGVYEFVSVKKERVTFRLGERRLWTERTRALGLFPTYEAAEDAKDAANYAMRRSRERRGYADKSCHEIVAKCEGYEPIPEPR